MKNYLFGSFIFLLGLQIQAQNKMNLIIGTYTNSCESKGIYVYDFSTETADFKLKSSTERVTNPSYFTVTKDNQSIYSVNENGAESTISAFGFNPKTGSLNFINKQSSKGADPCYIINDGENIIAANYSGGTIAVFKKNANGSISAAKQVIPHYGKSKNEQRQESPHVHMVHFSPDKKRVFAVDLGTDKIYNYQYNPTSKTRILEIKDSIDVTPGSGPRHITFSPNGKFAYLLHELDGSLTVFSYEKETLSKIQETTVIAKDFRGEISAADIHITPDGQFLYATNRGTANEISCFEIQKDGKLKFKFTTATLGKGPRNFVIDPTGKFLLVAHQYTNTVVIFSINKKTGALTDSQKRIALCAPVCLVFTP